MALECGKIFATEKSLNHYDSQDYPGEKKNRSVIAFRKLFQTLEFSDGQERRIQEQAPIEEAGQQLPGEEVMRIKRCKPKKPRISANPLQSTPNRQILKSERAVQYKEERKREFRRKCEEHSDKMSLGVNMPQMTQVEMREVKIGLMDLFKTEINPIMREFKPRTDDLKIGKCLKKHMTKHCTFSVYMS
jgi:hypothetical protein